MFFWQAGSGVIPVIDPETTLIEWDVLLDDLADIPQTITVAGGPFTGLGYTALTPSIDDGGVFDAHVPTVDLLDPTLYHFQVDFLGSLVGGTGHFYGTVTIVASGAAPVIISLHAYVHEPVVPTPTPEPVLGGGTGRRRKHPRVERYERWLQSEADALADASRQQAVLQAELAAARQKVAKPRPIKSFQGLADELTAQNDEADVILLLSAILSDDD